MDDQRAWPDAWPLDGWQYQRRIPDVSVEYWWKREGDGKWFAYTAEIVNYWVLLRGAKYDDIEKAYLYNGRRAVKINCDLSPLDVHCIVHDAITSGGNGDG